MKKRMFTDEVIAQIPQWVAMNMKGDEIAARIGCTTSSLKVRCSQLRISLRTPNWKVRTKRIAPPRPVAVEPKPIELPVGAPVAEMPKPKQVRKVRPLRMQSTIPLSRVALSLLRQRSEATGKTEAEIVTDLIEVIVRDNLYDAVLDRKEEAA